MKKLTLLLFTLCIADLAFGQRVPFPKDSVRIGGQYIVFYKAGKTEKTRNLIVAIQGCYSDGNTFANEGNFFAVNNNAKLVSIENKQKIFLNTPAIQDIIKKIELEDQVKFDNIYYLGFSCNAASGIAYGLENDIRFKGIIAFMPALDRVPFSYYGFSKDFPPIAIITGSKDFSYKSSKTMTDILTRYNRKKILLIDIPYAQHDFNIPEREASLAKAWQFINKKIML